MSDAATVPLTARAFADKADEARRVWEPWGFRVHVNSFAQTITIRPEARRDA